MQQSGFIDLRIDSADTDGANFWPGFTDVMTVIVLIFIMTMLSLLAKNMGLLDELTSAIELERVAQAEVKTMTEINEDLNYHLIGLEEELVQMQLSLASATEKHRQTLIRLGNSEQANAILNTALADSQSELASVLGEKDAWKLEQSKLNLKKAMLENSRSRFRRKSKKLGDELADIRAEFDERERKIQQDMVELEQLRASNVYCFQMGQEEARKEREAREERERKAAASSQTPSQVESALSSFFE